MQSWPHNERSWSAPVAVDDVPETGRHVDLTADERVRAAIAAVAGLRSLPRLTAAFDVTRHGRDGLHAVGQVSATVGQVCVVTIEPIENEIEELIDVIFTPEGVSPPTGDKAEERKRPAEVTDEDAPEPLINGVADLGALATEFLILAIDPYPHKPDAIFEPPASGDDAGHPFAALAALKKGESGQ